MNVISRMKRSILTQSLHISSPPNKRPRTREAARSAICFFRFPREIRDSVYGYVFNTPLTPLDTVQAKFNCSKLLSTGMLRISKRCHEECMEYIREKVEVRLYVGQDWDDRAKMLLRMCRHLTIVWDPVRNAGEVSHLSPWSSALLAPYSPN
jgi:hypothetical protein